MVTETKDIVLRRGGLNTLNNLLQSPGYSDDVKTAYLAGSILVGSMPEIEDVPKQPDGRPVAGEGLKKWLDAEFTLPLTGKQLKVCVKCVEYFIKQKQLTINPYTFELLEKLGMKPDED